MSREHVIVRYSLQDDVSGKLDNIKNKSKGLFGGINEGLTGAFSNMKNILSTGLMLGGIWEGLNIFKDSMNEWDKFESSVTKVNTALQSTNFAAGLSGEQIRKQAESLSKEIGAGKAEIQEAQAHLLTFTNVKEPVFEGTMQAVADMSAFFGTEMSVSAEAIGKALQSPTEGVARLTRQGVMFTDQQKAQIENYEKQGKLVEAQKLLLSELATEFGGQAKAAFAENPELQIQKRIEEFKLGLGGLIDTLVTNLTPAILSVIDGISGLWSWFTGASTGASILRTAIYAGIAAWGAYTVITGIAAAKTALMTWYTGLSSTAIILNTLLTEGWTASWVALNLAMSANPIGFIIAAVVALAAGFVYLWNKFEGFRKSMAGIGNTIFQFLIRPLKDAWAVLKGVFNIFKDIFTGNWSGISGHVKSMTAELKQNAKDVLEAYDKGATWAKDKKIDLTFGLGANPASDTKIKGTLPVNPTYPNKPKTDPNQLGDKSIKMSSSANYKTINLTVQKLVEELNINTTNLTESTPQIKQAITKALQEALADVQGFEN